MSDTTGQPGGSGPSENELRDRHLSRLLELYKHHYDLGLKGFLFYLGIVSAVATVVFHDEQVSGIKASLMILGAVISGLSAYACWNAVSQLTRVAKKINTLARELSLVEIHFEEARNFVYILMITAIAIGLFFLKEGFLG
jgi:hypothetical protein